MAEQLRPLYVFGVLFLGGSDGALLTGIVNLHGTAALPVGPVLFRDRHQKHAKCDTAVMTALVSQFTPMGFAVGADSLRCDMHGKVVTEKAVKLYSTNHPSFVGAYGFAGYTAIEYVDQRPMLNILEVGNHVADDLAHVPCAGPKEYVEDFCQDLAHRIAVASIGVVLPSKLEFMRAMFVGYHQRRPVRLQAMFPTVDGALQAPRLTELIEAPSTFCIASGSQVVWNELSQQAFQPETLQEAIDFVRSYIARCIENTDDPYCSTIGGRPQIATVTEQGFDWASRP